MHRNATLFPVPDGPMSTVISPRGMRTVTPSSTFTSPNALWTSTSSMTGSFAHVALDCPFGRIVALEPAADAPFFFLLDVRSEWAGWGCCPRRSASRAH